MGDHRHYEDVNEPYPFTTPDSVLGIFSLAGPKNMAAARLL